MLSQDKNRAEAHCMANRALKPKPRKIFSERWRVPTASATNQPPPISQAPWPYSDSLFPRKKTSPFYFFPFLCAQTPSSAPSSFPPVLFPGINWIPAGKPHFSGEPNNHWRWSHPKTPIGSTITAWSMISLSRKGISLLPTRWDSAGPCRAWMGLRMLGTKVFDI